MLALLHGYLLDGSGSNLWTRNLTEALCRLGETVHLVCQEGHPEDYPFLAEAHRYPKQGEPVTVFKREVPYPGKAIFHRIELGHQLPVFVEDQYEEFFNPTPMTKLRDEEIESYVATNARALGTIAQRHGITRIVVNHVVLLAVAVKRTGIPYAVVPHGSDLEYAVRKDPRLQRLASGALAGAGGVFVVTEEITARLTGLFPDRKLKVTPLAVGVDSSRFHPAAPSARKAESEKLARAVAKLPRGKHPARELSPDGLLSRLPKAESYAQWLRGASAYEGKLPDAGWEKSLAQVDWTRDPVALFVGRLIAAKGAQTVLAALPFLWKALPSLRVLMVGHGPVREVGEVFLAALKRGNVPWLEAVARWGSPLEGEPGTAYFRGVGDWLGALKAEGRWDEYLEAGTGMPLDRLHWTGYLSHGELPHTYPLADVAVIPSLVPEAGPMVLLEAAAAGCFPLGTYQAGIAHNLDRLFQDLPDETAHLARLDTDGGRAIADLIVKLPKAVGARVGSSLREKAVAHFDWTSLARRLLSASQLTNLAPKSPERAGNF